MNEIKFTPHEKRVLELPQDFDDNGPEVKVLRKIIDTFPWILEVSEFNFDPFIASSAIVSQAQIANAQEYFKAAIEVYKNRDKTK